MNKASVAIVFSVPFFVGCASITGDTVQSVKVETYAPSGEEVKGAKCVLENKNGGFAVTTPGTVSVRRSSEDMSVTCESAGQPDAKAVMVSRANAGMFGNIIFGGGIGAIIDHNKGTAYTYPQWIRLVFGRILSFDRSDDKDGSASVGRDVAGNGEKAAVVPPPSTVAAADKESN